MDDLEQLSAWLTRFDALLAEVTKFQSTDVLMVALILCATRATIASAMQGDVEALKQLCEESVKISLKQLMKLDAMGVGGGVELSN